MPGRRVARIRIYGLVQKVGYRMWTERQALMRGLEGWVRNRSDGTVEAVFAGPPDLVEAMIDLCRTGPSKASVERVDVEEASDVDLSMRSSGVGFDVLPTE